MNLDDYKPNPDALYFHISGDALLAANSEKDEFKIQQHVATSIVFTALCLESYINQEYSRHFEGENIMKHFDRLPLETKWYMLPLLLGSKATFDPGAEPFQTFSQIIKLRNERLVHFKPKKETMRAVKEANNTKPYLIELLKNVELAKKYFKCLSDMIEELHRLTGNMTHMPAFLRGHRYTQLKLVISIMTSSFESLGPEGEVE